MAVTFACLSSGAHLVLGYHLILKGVKGSVADPYHFDTDPDPGCEKIRYGSGSRVNFDTDPDPGKNYTDPDPDPAKKA